MPHTRSRGSVKELPVGKGWACVVMDQSATNLPSYELFHTVLIGATASNVKSFEGILLSSNTLGKWERIFQVLEAEAQKTPMILSEGIVRSKG